MCGNVGCRSLFFMIYIATLRVAIYIIKNKNPPVTPRGFLFFMIYIATLWVVIYIIKNKNPPVTPKGVLIFCAIYGNPVGRHI